MDLRPCAAVSGSGTRSTLRWPGTGGDQGERVFPSRVINWVRPVLNLYVPCSASSLRLAPRSPPASPRYKYCARLHPLPPEPRCTCEPASSLSDASEPLRSLNVPP